VRYLGVWLDDRLSFGHHAAETAAKAARKMYALQRLMPRVGGPTESRRRLLAAVVDSTILYGAPAWAHRLRADKAWRALEAVRRRAAIAVSSAYRTVSNEALFVITRRPPVRIAAKEREDKFRGSSKSEATAAGRLEWSRLWRATTNAGWTKILIPDLDGWLDGKHWGLNYRVTQALTGHGSFRSYTRRIGKEEVDACAHCAEDDGTNGTVDTPRHTLFECPQWHALRAAWEASHGCKLEVHDAPRILLDKGLAEDLYLLWGQIMGCKETAERARQEADRANTSGELDDLDDLDDLST